MRVVKRLQLLGMYPSIMQLVQRSMSIQEQVHQIIVKDYSTSIRSNKNDVYESECQVTLDTSFSIIYKVYQDIAQLVECNVWGVDVASSSPAILTNFLPIV